MTMLYERLSRPAVREASWHVADIPHGPLRIAEGTMRYRRRAPSRKRLPPGAVPSEEIERRVRARDHGAHWRRITSLNRRISAALTGELRTTWLSLEECLHDHWLEVALEHYQAGLEAGRAHAFASHFDSSTRDVRTRLLAIVAALSRLIAELEDRPGSS
jgi:hypothetical protein